MTLNEFCSIILFIYIDIDSGNRKYNPLIPDSFSKFYFIKHMSADIVHSKFAANLNDCNEVLRLVCLWLRRPFHFKKRVVMLNMGTRSSINLTDPGILQDK